MRLLYAALCGLSCMFFSQVLTAHSSQMGIDYLARKVAALLCHSNFLTTFDQDLWQAPRKTEGPREYAPYMGSSARAKWPTFLPL